jgi:hypothetical protein
VVNPKTQVGQDIFLCVWKYLSILKMHSSIEEIFHRFQAYPDSRFSILFYFILFYFLQYSQYGFIQKKRVKFGYISAIFFTMKNPCIGWHYICELKFGIKESIQIPSLPLRYKVQSLH